MKRFGFFGLFVILFGWMAASAAAMGNSKDPRDTEVASVGTEADPAIHQSEQSLQQLLFHADAPGKDRPAPALPADPEPVRG